MQFKHGWIYRPIEWVLQTIRPTNQLTSWPTDIVKPAPNVSDTKVKILDTAERMFATQGFAGTTMRNLVKAAGVNLAAVSYHFGSKEELHQAVIGRMASVITERQLAALQALDSAETEPSVEAILMAYIQPGFNYLLESEELRITRAQFMGRCRTEPMPIQERASEEFSVSHGCFLALLQRALPNQSEQELTWKLDMVVTMLIRALTETGRPNMLLRSASQQDAEHAVTELVKFAAAGIRAGSR